MTDVQLSNGLLGLAAEAGVFVSVCKDSVNAHRCLDNLSTVHSHL